MSGRALCEMLKEDSIRQNLLDMGKYNEIRLG
jgi:hypothetical protein